MIVGVTGGKGGPGTTVLAVKLALHLAESGRDCLLLDLDPCGGDVATYLDPHALDPTRGLLPLLKLGSPEGREAIERERQTITAHLSVVLGMMRPEPDLLRGRTENLLRSALGLCETVVADLGRMVTDSPSLEALALTDRLLVAVRPNLQGALAAERALALLPDGSTLVATQVRGRSEADVVELASALGKRVAASIPHLKDPALPRSTRRLRWALTRIGDGICGRTEPSDLRPAVPHEVAVP